MKNLLPVLLAVLTPLGAAAQTRGRVATPAVPVIGGPAITAAALGGLKAPSLTAPTLPSVTLSASLPTPAVLPAAPSAMAVRAMAAPMAAAAAASAAAPEAAKAEKPVIAALEAAAKPFADEKGRSGPGASEHLARSFDASTARADDPAAVVPGVRNWPRVAGVGLARPFNGVSEERPQTPAPKKASDEKPMGKWERIGTGVLLALALAGSLYTWFLLYDSMANVMYNATPSIEQQYYGPAGGWEDLFGR